MNTIEPEDLAYPLKPDGNGYARRYFRRKAYYFGEHNSPESFALFGEWRRLLIETGAPPSTKIVRRDIGHVFAAAGGAPRRWSRSSTIIALGSTIAVLLMLITLLLTAQFLSSGHLPHVDELAMDESEMDLVRGARKQREAWEDQAKARRDRTAELTAIFMEEGLSSESLHTTKRGS